MSVSRWTWIKDVTVFSIMTMRMDRWILPDSLIREPSSITLVVSVIVSSLELGWSGDGGAVLDTGCLGLLKRQGVAGGDGSVVEHDTCEIQEVSGRQKNCGGISFK